MRARLGIVLALSLSLSACPSEPDDGTDGGMRDDVPGLDAPGLDAPGLDAPPIDAPGADVPEVPGDLPRIGHCGSTRGRYAPASSWIYTDISSAPVRSNSAATTAWLEGEGGWGFGRMQIDASIIVIDDDGSAPRVTHSDADPEDQYLPDCDPDLPFPIPAGGRIEGYDDYVCPGRASGSGEGDCHLIVADLTNRTLFESYHTSYEGGQLYSLCTLSWDMDVDLWGAPPAPGPLPSVGERNWGRGRDCTSTDAAGFPVAPLLFTTEEVAAGRIDHAIRFILPNARMQRAPSAGAEGPVYVWPATHAGGPSAVDPDAPIYGSRWRLRADFDPAAAGLNPDNLVVIAVVRALQRYGMVLADGGNIALTAESDEGCAQSWEDLWGDDGPRALEGIEPSDFEIIDTGGTDAGFDCEPNPAR